MIEAFSPINNNQAIRNFSTGSGKSSSFFLFTDNKQFVLKTMRGSEEALLFGNDGILESYFNYIIKNH